MLHGLFEPLLKAGVFERDPSYNRFFIEPCLRYFGVRTVNQTLIEYFTKGTKEEQAGINQAWYWLFGLNGLYGIPYEDVNDLAQAIKKLKSSRFH